MLTNILLALLVLIHVMDGFHPNDPPEGWTRESHYDGFQANHASGPGSLMPADLMSTLMGGPGQDPRHRPEAMTMKICHNTFWVFMEHANTILFLTFLLSWALLHHWESFIKGIQFVGQVFRGSFLLLWLLLDFLRWILPLALEALEVVVEVAWWRWPGGGGRGRGRGIEASGAMSVVFLYFCTSMSLSQKARRGIPNNLPC